jgi:hypothetical protein
VDLVGFDQTDCHPEPVNPVGFDQTDCHPEPVNPVGFDQTDCHPESVDPVGLDLLIASDYGDPFGSGLGFDLVICPAP